VEAALSRGPLIQAAAISGVVFFVFLLLGSPLRGIVVVFMIPIAVVAVIVLALVRLVRSRSRPHPGETTGSRPVRPAGAEPERGSLALASMICGLLALVVLVAPLGWVALSSPVFGVAGIVLAIVSRVRIRRRTGSGKIMSTMGLVFSSLSLIIIVAAFLFALMLAEIMNSSG
jgi:hypothetical protein